MLKEEVNLSFFGMLIIHQKTPLHIASMNGNVEILTILLKHGADIRISYGLLLLISGFVFIIWINMYGSRFSKWIH